MEALRLAGSSYCTRRSIEDGHFPTPEDSIGRPGNTGAIPMR